MRFENRFIRSENQLLLGRVYNRINCRGNRLLLLLLLAGSNDRSDTGKSENSDFFHND